MTISAALLLLAAFYASSRSQESADECPSESALSKITVEAPPSGDASAFSKPLESIEHPRENPATAEKIALGRELFFDTRLSQNDQISCATCHDPDKGFSNGRRFATGIEGRQTARHVPSLINVGYSTSFFWDGRAATLEQQALLPIQTPEEMAMPLEVLEKKLNGIASYRELFEQAFDGKVTPTRIGQALAAFERTIVSNDTPYDRYLNGDGKALSPSAVKGMQLFFGRARCAICHKGSALTDNQFHNIGAADLPDDVGRAAVTGRNEHQGAFRTPQLREVASSAPYMHNGKFETLKDVVQHYNFGGVTDQANDHRDEELEVLYLSEDEVDDLVHFLTEGLTSPPAVENTSRQEGSVDHAQPTK